MVIREVKGGVRYILPRRNLLFLRIMGCVPFLVGIGFCGVSALWMLGAAMLYPEWAWTGIPFLLIGMLPIFFGMYAMVGHDELEINDRFIRFAKCVGPIHRTQKRFVRPLARIVVGKMPMFDRGWIRFDFQGLAPLIVCRGNLIEDLEKLAQDISKRFGVEIQSDDEVPHEHAPVIEENVPPQAVGTLIDLQHFKNGLVMKIPPSGLRKMKGLFIMGIVWTVFSVAMTVGFLLGGEAGDAWFAIPFMGLFDLVGVFLILAAANMGTRTATIEITRDVLTLHRRGIFGQKVERWSRNDIQEIKSGPSGMEINGVPVLELQIHFKGRKKVGLCSGRDDRELNWMAAELQRFFATKAS